MEVFCYCLCMKYYVILTNTYFALMKLLGCLELRLGRIFLSLACLFKINTKAETCGLLVRRVLYVTGNGLKGTGTLSLCVYKCKVFSLQARFGPEGG